MPLLNPNLNSRRASAKQLELIEQLIIDCSLLDKRKLLIQSRFNKSYFDELTISEASSLIDELLEIKDRRPGGLH